MGSATPIDEQQSKWMSTMDEQTDSLVNRSLVKAKALQSVLPFFISRGITRDALPEPGLL